MATAYLSLWHLCMPLERSWAATCSEHYCLIKCILIVPRLTPAYDTFLIPNFLACTEQQCNFILLLHRYWNCCSWRSSSFGMDACAIPWVIVGSTWVESLHICGLEKAVGQIRKAS